MTWRQRKFLRNGTHLTVLVLLMVTIFGYFQNFWNIAAVLTSAVSMTLLVVQLPRLIKQYYDSICRLEVYVPVGLGLVLGTTVMIFSPARWLAAFACLQMTGWLLLLVIHLRQRKNFVRIGPGLMPDNVWWCPPIDALKAGDVIMMEGIIAKKTMNSVGHTEMVVMHDGKLVTITAFFEKGVVLFKTARAALRLQEKLKLGWAIIRPRGGFNEEQNRLAVAYAERKQADNRARVERDHPRTKAWLDRVLPDNLKNLVLVGLYMPAFKRWVWSLIEPTGYDLWSYRIGTHQRDLWTCKYIVEQTARHAGVPVEEHESGALGLGTGLFNPPYPMSLMEDSAYRLLTLDDKNEHATAKSKAVADPS